LARLGEQSFREAFGPDNSSSDIDAYVLANFSPDRLSIELADAATHYLIAEIAGDAAGYAKLHWGTGPSTVSGPRAVELSRIYALAKWLGRGVGHALMSRCLEEAREAGADAIWLGVWERNERAIAFYEKWDFVHVGEQQFLLGSDRQTDWIMTRRLDEPSASDAVS
jgi:diamine N-acetyltransferase